ncbi:MAG: hypothetical protein ABEI57_06425, partial [Halapricum sp.]
LRSVSRFLDDHWILKWFVVPIWFMAAILLVLFTTVSTAGTPGTLQVAALFVGFSLAAVGVGLGIEYCLYRVTGAQFLHSRSDRE